MDRPNDVAAGDARSAPLAGRPKVIIVMPAYNAARTLEQTHAEVLSTGVVDLVIVVDDASKDETTTLARTLPHTIVHTHVPAESAFVAAFWVSAAVAVAGAIIARFIPTRSAVPALVD